MPTAEQLITEHLDLWTAAIKRKPTAARSSSYKVELYGIKRLRLLILELAMRGLLVPQDPKDEPASELLKKIAAEKSKLVKRAEINKGKSLPPVGMAERRFELPPGWLWERFGNLAEHNAGKTLDQGRNQGDLRDYITTSNLYWGKFDLSAVRQMPIEEGDLDKCLAIQNDLLICEGGEAGRAAVWNHDYPICFQNHIHRARFWQGISPHYAYRLLEKMSYSGEIDDFRKGVGISNMSGKALASIPFPLAPVAEQHRIVAKIDELMALCDQLEQQTDASRSAHQTLAENLLNALTRVSDSAKFVSSWQRIAERCDILFTTEESIDQLKQTILQLAVMGKLVQQDLTDEPASELLKKIAAEKANLVKEGKIKPDQGLPSIDHAEKPYVLPETWAWEWLPNISFFQEGPGIMAKDFRAEGVPLIRISGVHGALVTLDGCNFLDEDMVAKKWNHFRLELNDIILSASASLGKVSKVGAETVGCVAYTGLIRFRPLKSVFDEYLIRFLGSREFARQIDDSKRGAAILHFGPTHLKGMIVPVPPLAEQHRIVARVDELMSLCEQLKSRLIDAQATQLQLADALTEQALAEG